MARSCRPFGAAKVFDCLPIASSCSFGKNALTSEIVRYLGQAEELRTTDEALIKRLSLAAPKAANEALSEASRVLYQQLSDAKPKPIISSSSFKRIIRPNTHYIEVLGPGSLEITFTVGQPGTWTFDPDNISLTSYYGLWILPTSSSWTPTIVSKGKGKETQHISFDFGFYDNTTSSRLLIFCFRSSEHYLIKIPIFLLARRTKMTLQTFPDPVSQIDSTLVSMPHSKLRTGMFHLTQGDTHVDDPSEMVSKYDHPRLAKPIGRSNPNLGEQFYYIFESSPRRLPLWLSNPFPLVAGKHPDLIELSKYAILSQVASALSFIHEQGLIHGDLSIEAVFLDQDNSAKLVWNCEIVPEIPTQEKVMGNPTIYHYLAPEIFWENLTSLKASTDVFAFGILMYEVLTGEPLGRVGDDICSGVLPPLKPWNEVAPRSKLWSPTGHSNAISSLFSHSSNPTFNDVLLKCVSPDPSSRPRMDEIAVVLEDAFGNVRGDSFHVINRLCTYCKTRSDVEWNQATHSSGEHLLHLEHSTSSHVSAVMPPNLESLLVPSSSGFTRKVIVTLPESLKLLYAPQATWSIDWFSDLPSGIEQFWVDKAMLPSQILSPYQVRFPSNLIALSIGDLDLSTISPETLPDGLKTLHAGCLNMSVSTCDIRHWPSSLTALSVPGYKAFTLEASRSLPKSLTMLVTPGIVQLDSLYPSLLPAGLLHLDLSGVGNATDKQLSELPRKLTSLDISSAIINDKSEFGFISGGDCSSLPHSLTNLLCMGPDVRSKPMYRAGARVLPELRSWSWNGQHPVVLDMWNLLPPTLTYLSIPDSFVDFSKPDFFENLPRVLRHLSIPKAAGISDDAVPLLPRGLTHLNIRGNANWTDVAAMRLPRSLIYLDASNTHWSPDAVPWLPSLQYLILVSNTSWNDNCAKFLPRTLKSLDLRSNAKMTRECVDEMPESLTYLRMGYGSTLSPAWNVRHALKKPV